MNHIMNPLRRHLPFVITCAAGILISVVLFFIVHDWVKKNQRIEFESRSMGYANAVKQSIHDYVESLKFFGDFINNSEQVTRKDFSEFAMSAISRHPGIQAFSWNPLILNSERAEYEARAQEEGFENFMFTERTENNELVRAAQRDEYVIVYYIEPLEDNKPAFGFNIASNPLRLKAINQSFDTGNLSATDRVTLVQEEGEQYGILLLLPIYKKNVSLKTTEDRRKHRKGFIVEVLRIGDFVEIALKDFSDEGINVYLYDLSAEEKNRFLYFRSSHISGMTKQHLKKEEIQKGLHWSKNFDVAGRRWQVLFSPSSFYLKSQQSWQAWIVLSGSLFLTYLLASYLSRKSFYTAEIEQQLQRNEQILRTTLDGFILADTEGTLRKVNASYCEMSGYSEEELLKKNIRDIEVTLSSEEINQRISKMIEQGRDRFETRHRCKDGNFIDLDVSVSIMSGNRPLVAAFVRNITERKRTEQVLMMERMKAQQYLKTVQTIIVSLDSEGSVTMINRKGCELLGYSEDELIGENWFKTCLPQPEGINHVYPYFKQIISGKIESQEYFENHVVTRNGTQRLIAWHNALFRNDTGDIIGTLSSGDDITERKQAELELLEEKKFTETAIDAQKDTFFLFEPVTGKAFRWNKQFREISGYSDEEISAMKAPDSYYSQEDLEKAKGAMNDVMSQGLGKAEISLICKDGRRVPFEYMVSVIRDNDNKIKYLVSIGRDITERKKAEDALIKSETKFRSVVESSPMGMHMYQLESGNRLVFTGNNHAADQILGVDNSQFIGKTIEDAFPPLISTEVPDHYRRVAGQGESWMTEQIAYEDEKISGAYQVHAFQTEPGKMVAMFLDITERKKAENIIATERQRLFALFDALPAFVYLQAPDYTIKYSNRYYKEHFGETAGKLCYESLWGRNEPCKICHTFNVFDTKKPQQWEWDGAPDGRIYEINDYPFTDTDGTQLVLELGIDITKRKKSEKEQKRLTKELIIKNRELEQVLYVTSHDLRSPLVNIDGYSQELYYSLRECMSSIEDASDLSSIKEKIALIIKEDIPESLHYIQSSVAKMETLIRGILSLSRLGSSERKKEKIDMNEMMTTIIDNHRFRLNELRIKTEISTLPDCTGDSAQINQVFSNLLDNAIKYSASERSGVIHISGFQDNNQSVYCMEDNGIGIAPRHQDKIFEIFHQLAPRKIKGEGMGLTIAHRIIEKHNGKIWLESEPGKGSRFFISLPEE